MRADSVEAALEEAIGKCMKDGTPECLKELSELANEQEHLLENKYLLYKMVMRHLMKVDTSRAHRP